MNNSQSNRFLYLDYIKTLGICLVILYHCKFTPFNSSLIWGVYAVCVPLFFMVNGYLMLRKEYTIVNLLHKNVKLLFVMFFWAFFSTFVYAYTSGIIEEYTTNITFEKIIVGSKYLGIKSLTISKPECNHLWFLKSIFILNLLNPILYNFIKNNNRNLLYIVILLAFWSINFFDIITCRLVNPIVDWSTSFSVLYYLLGYIIYTKFNNKLLGSRGICIFSVVIILCAILQNVYNWIFIDGFMKNLNESKGWIVDIVYDNYGAFFIVIMTSAICALFQRINWRENRFWRFVGENSLAIYLLQTPIQRLIQHWLPIDSIIEIHHGFGIILPILTLFTCMSITRLLLTNKYTKYLITI